MNWIPTDGSIWLNTTWCEERCCSTNISWPQAKTSMVKAVSVAVGAPGRVLFASMSGKFDPITIPMTANLEKRNTSKVVPSHRRVDAPTGLFPA